MNSIVTAFWVCLLAFTFVSGSFLYPWAPDESFDPARHVPLSERSAMAPSEDIITVPDTWRSRRTTEDGLSHRATCDDWETAAMFYRFAKERGSGPALADMERVFNEEYPAKGMVFAMGTHSLYPKVWLLVGVVKLDVAPQRSLLL